MRLKLFPLLFFVFGGVFASTYYLELYNPNSYPLYDFQVPINITKYNISLPIAKIILVNGTSIPFCYEQPNLECNETYQNTTGIIWAKIPYIPAKRYTFIKVIVNYSNGAVHGDQVFDFYDDFNSNQLDTSKWILREYSGTGCSKYYEEINGRLHIYVYSTRDNCGYNFTSTVNFTYPTVVEMLGSWTKLDWYRGGGPIAGLYILTDSSKLNGLDIRLRGDYKVVLARLINSSWTQVADVPEWWSGDFYFYYGVAENSLWKLNGTYSYETSVSDYLIYPYNIVFATYLRYWTDAVKVDTYYDVIRVRKYADTPISISKPYIVNVTFGSPNYRSHPIQVNFLFAQPISIYVNSLIGSSYVTIPFHINTKKYISNGWMKSDCSDIAITLYNPTTDTEQDLPFWLDPATCNTPNTVIYVKLPVYAISQDAKLFIYFGSTANIYPARPTNVFYYFIDFSDRYYYQNITIYTNGTANYTITNNGINISIGDNGALVIYTR